MMFKTHSDLFDRLERQQEFIAEINAIDKFIAEKDFAPREFYDKIDRYHYMFDGDNRTRREAYWHTNVPLEDPDDMHRSYYANAKGLMIHLSFECASNLNERNKIHFGANSKTASKLFASEISRLRRLAKLANTQLEEASAVYNDTPHGVAEALSEACYDMYDKIDRHVDYNRNYERLQKTSGGDYSQSIYLHNRSGHIGRLRYENKSFSYNNNRPEMPTFIAFFECPQIQAEVDEMMKSLKPLMDKQAIQVELYEQELVVNRLKGIN